MGAGVAALVGCPREAIENGMYGFNSSLTLVRFIVFYLQEEMQIAKFHALLNDELLYILTPNILGEDCYADVLCSINWFSYDWYHCKHNHCLHSVGSSNGSGALWLTLHDTTILYCCTSVYCHPRCKYVTMYPQL